MAQSLVRSYSSVEILTFGALVRVDLLSVGVGAVLGTGRGGDDGRSLVTAVGVCLTGEVGEGVCALSPRWLSSQPCCPAICSGGAGTPPSTT